MTANVAAIDAISPERRMQRLATARLMRVAPDHRDRVTDPIGYWDAYTSGCDARTALSLAIGAHPDSIDPSTGTFTTTEGAQP